MADLTDIQDRATALLPNVVIRELTGHPIMAAAMAALSAPIRLRDMPANAIGLIAPATNFRPGLAMRPLNDVVAWTNCAKESFAAADLKATGARTNASRKT